MASEADKALGYAAYWDNQYAQGKGHEWFRSFTQLKPLLQSYVLAAEGFKAKDDPTVLHLGSGDSVR